MEKRDCDGRCGKTKRDGKQVGVGTTREMIARVKARKRERERTVKGFEGVSERPNE